jgi:hypothetical protein
MESQKSIDYYAMFSELVKRHNELTQQRNDTDLEIAKLTQLILATFPLLPEDKQKLFQTEIELLEEQSAGLLSAIKLVFSTRKGEWISPAQVREYLNAMGFDLTQYRANPLASIATTLRRMVPEQLESRMVGEQVKYRRRITLLDRMGRESSFDPNLLPDSIRGLVQPAVTPGGVGRGERAASEHPAMKLKQRGRNKAFYGE